MAGEFIGRFLKLKIVFSKARAFEKTAWWVDRGA
jgi:hypothetical protein